MFRGIKTTIHLLKKSSWWKGLERPTMSDCLGDATGFLYASEMCYETDQTLSLENRNSDQIIYASSLLLSKDEAQFILEPRFSNKKP
ncbi:hypothetical protein TNCT_449741 [Trichonephila clavata]|uniref:Uncharacterized protein n=1 Tax=Trichonephila clavata TaxID=2740835 RepID=A0A8X6IZP2_TRICU|nr:hypothetical protein TNCT_449741 [Trichonephila clavata]